MSAKSRKELIDDYLSVRKETQDICKKIEIEDYVVQPVPEVSPPKWHLAHTTWFFEEVILSKHFKKFTKFNKQYGDLFNSYYKSAGKHWIQGERGHLSRPTVREVLDYRKYIDEKMVSFLRESSVNADVDFLVEVGLHHEQQHQELLFMDIKFILGVNPLLPRYSNENLPDSVRPVDKWKNFNEGVYKIGHQGPGFSYDNEGPRHKVYLNSYSIMENFVTNGEYLEFIKDKGYSNALLWPSLGWDWVSENNITCPLYWNKKGKNWSIFTLHGLKKLDPHAPVTHISYFEASAYACWKQMRLPTEEESEVFLQEMGAEKYTKGKDIFHPNNASSSVGQVWWWTKSHYSSYPGYQTFKGMLEEYNGKFMCNQFVLKGGCVGTPKGHYRHSYRNFFGPHQRWMFSGIRLVKDL